MKKSGTMKHLLFAFIFFIHLYSFGQTPISFSEHIIDSSISASGILKISTGDFNQDSLEDVAVTQGSSDEVAVYFKNPNGSYGSRQLLSIQQDYPKDISVADLNNDNWPDIAVLSLHDHKLMWYPNINGSFGSGRLVDTTYYFGVEVIAKDFNNDGFTDLLGVDDTAASYYQNDGNGNFAFSKLAGRTEFYSVGVADINSDGFQDVLLGSVLLYTYINNGNGSFTRDTRNESLINNFIFEIELADIDGDSDQDMAIYYSNTFSEIDWYENDGTGKFSLVGPITNSSNDVHSMRFSDFNNDSAPDFVTAYGQSGELVWMENDGTGNFSSEQVLKTYSVLPRQVAVADAEQDGDTDLFFSHNSEGFFYWENQTFTFDIREETSKSAVFPNPAGKFIHLTLQEPGEVRILNSSGKLLFNKSLQSGTNLLQLNLPQGLYFVHWQEGRQNLLQKLVIH